MAQELASRFVFGMAVFRSHIGSLSCIAPVAYCFLAAHNTFLCNHSIRSPVGHNQSPQYTWETPRPTETRPIELRATGRAEPLAGRDGPPLALAVLDTDRHYPRAADNDQTPSLTYSPVVGGRLASLQPGLFARLSFCIRSHSSSACSVRSAPRRATRARARPASRNERAHTLGWTSLFRSIITHPRASTVAVLDLRNASCESEILSHCANKRSPPRSPRRHGLRDDGARARPGG